MIIKTLVENTSVSPKYKSKHGVCFYIETDTHKILFDLGPNDLFLINAQKMGIDISAIDTVIISHGHIDHAGALKLFLDNNKTARIYIRENAFNKYFTKIFSFYFNVGLDRSFMHHPQIILTKETTQLDDQLMLFSDIHTNTLCSRSNNALYTETDGVKCLDNFSHEQSLIISHQGSQTLIAGCSHTGIINIRNRAEEIINGRLTYIIAGFHLYNPVSRKTESSELVQKIAEQLINSDTSYYTCHCTGSKAFKILKKVLSDKISYLSTGSELKL